VTHSPTLEKQDASSVILATSRRTVESVAVARVHIELPPRSHLLPTVSSSSLRSAGSRPSLLSLDNKPLFARASLSAHHVGHRQSHDKVPLRYLAAKVSKGCKWDELLEWDELTDALGQIDWNKVAHDPILAQEITNGHAARMRYSRFRAAMLGIEPQRRNRTANPNRSRVSKKKKDDARTTNKTSKDETGPVSGSGIKSENSGPVKRERDAADRAETPSSMIMSPMVKEERIFPTPTPNDGRSQLNQQHHSQQHPLAGFASDMQFRPHSMRLLTPCSDSDVLTTASQPFGHHSPAASDMLHPEPAMSFNDFCREPPHHHNESIAAWNHHAAATAAAAAAAAAVAHQQQQQQQQAEYAAGFSIGVPMPVSYGGTNTGEEPFSTFCEHPDDSHHTQQYQHHAGIVVPDELGVHAMLEQEGQVVVKHEEYDTQAY